MYIDPCSTMVGVTILFGPPLLLCWTAAVLATRYLRDLPISFRIAFEAFVTGFQLILVGTVPSAILGLAVGLPVALILAWSLQGTENLATIIGIAAAIAPLFAIFVFFVKVFLPILTDDWRRLVKNQEVVRRDETVPAGGAAPRPAADEPNLL